MSVSSVTVGGKVKYKLVLLGNQHVGKSAIIDRFINDRFQQSYHATIGIDFLVRNIVHESKTYRLQLWDTAGQQRFKALIPSYLKDSNCALIVYDIADPKSLQSVQKWLEFYNQHKENIAFGVMVGNKSDISHYKQSCTSEEIKKMAAKFKVPDYRISAKTGEGVNEFFLNLINHISEFQRREKEFQTIEQRKEEEETNAKVEIDKNNNIKLDQEIQKEMKQIKRCC